MTKPKQFWMAAALLLASDVGHASDCSPGSPMYEDAYFTICDAARETDYLGAAVVLGKTQDVRGSTNRPSAERSHNDHPQLSGPLELDSGDIARR